MATKVGQIDAPDQVCVTGFQLREALDVDRLRARRIAIPSPRPKRLTDLLDAIQSGETDDPYRSGWWYEPPSESDDGRWCLGPRLARLLGLGGPRLPSSGGDGAVSAWARSRSARIGSNLAIVGSNLAIVGQMVTGPTENRAALDRTDIRWRSLKRDIAAEQAGLGAAASPAFAAYRREFLESFEAWRRFYVGSIDNVAGDLWPLSDLGLELERWDATLEAYRSRYREITGREPSSPTDASTAPRRPLGAPDTGIGDAITWIAIAAIVIGIAWWFSSASSIGPRLVGAGSTAVPS